MKVKEISAYEDDDSITIRRTPKKVGVSDKCDFRAESLEKISINDSSINYIIGHASLHHFIKYEAVPNEFRRVMKNEAKGFFADSFGAE